MTFDEEFLRRIEQLKMNVRKMLSGKGEGNMPLRRGGGADNFRSHRPYAPGDEFRYIDWNVAARTGQLQVKEFIKDEGFTVSLLMDESASMRVGSPDKSAYSRQVALALSAIALDNADTLQISSSGGGIPRRNVFRGSDAIVDILRLLSRADDAKGENFAGVVADILVHAAGRQFSIILSDLWDLEAIRERLKLGSAAGHQIVLLHLLSRDELEPPQRGNLRLCDSESGEVTDHFITDEEAAAYKRLLHDHCGRWRSFCLHSGIIYRTIPTDTTLEEAVLVLLRECGVLA